VKLHHPPLPFLYAHAFTHTSGEEASCQGEALTDGGRTGGSLRGTKSTKGGGEGQESEEHQVSQTTLWEYTHTVDSGCIIVEPTSQANGKGGKVKPHSQTPPSFGC